MPRDAPRRGTKVFIATGRPFYQINNLGELRFDGYVTLNGAWCIDAQGEVIFSNPIPHEDLEAVNRQGWTQGRFSRAPS